MIKINDLTISFGSHVVLQNIDLQIKKNEITTIVGQSGCGKSVLMKAIEGLIVPEQGTIQIDGEELLQQKRDGVKRIHKKIAMLFQGAALLDSLTVFQNIALPLREHTKLTDQEIIKIVDEKLKLVGLEDVLEKMPSELSGGMKKRVALARAIILQPEYIIYDEPTTGLDPIIADEITQLIKKLHNTYKITTIIITHDLDCIRKLHSKIVMISDKQIIFSGDYKEFADSKNNKIRQFIDY